MWDLTLSTHLKAGALLIRDLTPDLKRNPDKQIQALLGANKDLDPKLQKAAVKITLPFFQPPRGKPFGWQSPAQWKAFAAFMKKSGLLQGAGSASGAFSNALLAGQGP